MASRRPATRRQEPRPEPRLHRARRLPRRQDRLAVLDLHRLFVGRLERRSRSLRSVRHAPDRLHLHRRQRLHRCDRTRRRWWIPGISSARSGLRLGDFYALDSYVPHVVGGVGWTGGWGGVSVVAGYDAVWEEGAVKGRVDFNVTDAISMFVMAGWGTVDDDFADGVGGADRTARTTTLLGAATMPSGSVALGSSPSRRPSTSKSAMTISKTFSVAANVDYELVPNLHIIPEIVYYDGGKDFTLIPSPIPSSRAATTTGAASSASSITGAADIA